MPAQGTSNRSEQPAGERSAALLLVERDDGLRRFLFWALYLEGFKVLTAGDAANALRLSRDVAGAIELMILGSLPPGSNAAELQQQIEGERSELRTVLLQDLTQSGDQAGVNESVNAGILIQRVKAMVGRS